MKNTQPKFLLIKEEGLHRLLNPELIFSASLSGERLTIFCCTGQTMIVCGPSALVAWKQLLCFTAEETAT